MDIKQIRKEINNRKKELEAFDRLSEEEKTLRTKAGLNPYESPKLRKRKREAELERRKKLFCNLPKKEREILTSLGLNPFDDDPVIIRTTGYIKIKE